jgi:hypothetical protein
MGVNVISPEQLHAFHFIKLTAEYLLRSDSIHVVQTTQFPKEMHTYDQNAS